MALRSLHEFAHPAIRTTLPSPQGGAPHGAGTRANSPTGQTGWQAGGEHTLQASSVRTIRRASRASARPRQPRIPRAPHAPPREPPGGASPPRPPAATVNGRVVLTQEPIPASGGRGGGGRRGAGTQCKNPLRISVARCTCSLLTPYLLLIVLRNAGAALHSK